MYKKIGQSGPRLSNLDILRGLACLLVCYSHLFWDTPNRLGYGEILHPIIHSIHESIFIPFGITQEGGWLGVCVFFLISGFVIPLASLGENFEQFWIKRFFRIFPLLFLMVFVFSIVPDIYNNSLKDFVYYLKGATLVGYFTQPQIIFIGVAWTLVIELIFYSLVSIFSIFIKCEKNNLFSFLLFFVPAFMLSFKMDFGGTYFLFCVSLAYIFILNLGAVIFLAWSRRMTLISFLLFFILNYVSFKVNIQDIYNGNNVIDGYFVSINYAIFVFIVSFFISKLTLTNSSIRESVIIRLYSFIKKICLFFGKISYSLYLVHAVLGVPLFIFLTSHYFTLNDSSKQEFIKFSLDPTVGGGKTILSYANSFFPVTDSLLIFSSLSLLVSILLSSFLFYFVEKPIINYSKKISKLFN